MPLWWNGIHSRLKICRPIGHTGSNPVRGTPKGNTMTTAVSVHCIECDSEDIVMIDATVNWDKQNQKWEYNESYNSRFLCANCAWESSDFIEKEL